MRFRVFFLCCTLCTVFYASTCYAEDKRLIAEQEDVIKQTEESRAAAAKSAKEWEAHIEKLNSEVIPDDHFSHDALKVRSHIAHKHAIHRMMAKSAAKHLKSQSAAKHLKPLAAEHKVKHMENQVWHHQTASELLAHDKKIAAESTPSEPKQSVSAFHDTAEAMYARRKAEVDAAFPSSWMSASKEKAQKPKKVVLSSNDKKWAEEVAYRQKAMNAYQTSRNKVKQMKEEFETHMERSKAAQEAAKELTHLSAISDEVWPRKDSASIPKVASVHKSIASHSAQHGASSKKSIAGPHAPQQRPHDWRSGSPPTGHASRSVPMSSDSTIPSAGTDVAYIGAHQAGFVRKPHPAAATHAPLRVKTDYPYGTVASPLERSAKAASQAPRDARAEHSAHRQAAAAAKAPTAQPAAPPAKAARAMPESSDATVPEMGTNVVFEGASASGTTGQVDHGAVPY